MIQPGPITVAGAKYLNEQLTELEKCRKWIQSFIGDAPELIPAALTSATTVTWTTAISPSTTATTTYSAAQHGWYEQAHDYQGVRVTMIGGRTGTALVDPARMPDGAVVSATPTSPVNVWLRKIGLAQSFGIIHEVVSLLGNQSARFLTFGLASTLSTLITSVTSCTVYLYWGGSSPGANVTVHNIAASATTTFIFAAGAGKRGIASWDEVNNRWEILQVECP